METRRKFGRQTLDAAKDENAVVFTKAQMSAFQQVREAVEQAIATPQASGVPAQAAGSVADELAKLADLHRQGILTEAEFTAQKARVLGG